MKSSSSSIMDLRNKKSNPEVENENTKKCSDCGTTKTPLWRSGPAGPKSLCNACGIRCRKKEGVISTMKQHEKQRAISASKRCMSSGSTSSGSGSGSTVTTISISTSTSTRKCRLRRNGGTTATLHRRLVSRSTRVGKRTIRMRKKLGEVEQAAVLLMALSYGSLYA